MGLFDSAKGIIQGGAKVVSGNPIGGFQDQFNAITDLGDFKSMIPGIGDAIAADKANKLAIDQAQKQMDFQERMSNSAYQRAMSDMKKAGLNPMLAFSQGGASVPSGAAAPIQTASKSKLGEFVMSSALGIHSQAQNQQRIDNELKQGVANVNLANVQSAKALAEAENTRVDTILKKKDVPQAQLKGDLSEKATQFLKRVYQNVSNSAKSSKSTSKPGVAKDVVKDFFNMKDSSSEPLIKVPKPH